MPHKLDLALESQPSQRVSNCINIYWYNMYPCKIHLPTCTCVLSQHN